MNTTIKMTVEGAIHRRWAGDSALCAILPAERLTTGPGQGEQLPGQEFAPLPDGSDEDQLPAAVPLPCGTINRQSNQAAYRSSTGRGDEGSFRLQVWTNDHSDGVAITQRMKDRATFDDADWTDQELVITSCRVENDFHLLEDDGTWQFVIDLSVQAQLRG